MEMGQQQQQQHVNRFILNAIASHRRGIEQSFDWRVLAWLRNRGPDRERLTLLGCSDDDVDTQFNATDMQCLVDYLQGENNNNNNNSDEDSHEVKDLALIHLRLLSQQHPPPSDGNSAFQEFFARSDTFWECDFGTAEDASQLIAAFETNRTVADLEIIRPDNLGLVDLSNCLSNLLENDACLERLACSLNYSAEINYHYFGPTPPPVLLGLQNLQRGLRVNRTLKKLILVDCHLQDEGMHVIADALEGNSTMEEIDLSRNRIRPLGLRAIARLMESTHIKTIIFGGNYCFENDDTTLHFSRVLSRSIFVKCLDASQIFVTAFVAAMIFQALHVNNVLEHLRLPRFIPDRRQQGIKHLVKSLPRMKSLKRLELHPQDFENGCLPQHAAILLALHLSTNIEELSAVNGPIIDNNNDQYSAERAEILNITARNRGLNRANLLLQPHPRTGAIVRLKSRVWQKAIVKLASSNSASSARNSGASAIFHLLQKRPGLLEPRLSPPRAESQSSPVASSSPWSTSPSPPPQSPVETGYYASGNNDDSPPAAAAAARLSGGPKREHNIDNNNNNNNRSLDTGYYASGNNDDSPPSAARLNSGRKREHVQDNDDNNNKPFGGRNCPRQN